VHKGLLVPKSGGCAGNGAKATLVALEARAIAIKLLAGLEMQCAAADCSCKIKPIAPEASVTVYTGLLGPKPYGC
jgi:hypothetical protein